MLKSWPPWRRRPDVEVLAVHVSRTGGTSFGQILDSVYGRRSIHRDYAGWPRLGLRRRDPARWSRERAHLWRKVPGHTKVVYGHYPLVNYLDMAPAAARIVWLRDPVDRLVSHYHLWRSVPPDPGSTGPRQETWSEQTPFMDFVRRRDLRDNISRWYLRDIDPRTMTFIGIQERFTEDMERLRALMGWPPVGIPMTNQNPSTDYHGGMISAEERREIEALNPLDMALYRQVLTGSLH